MLSLHNLGIGKLQLGANLNSVGPVLPFEKRDSSYFIPTPDPQSWYKYDDHDIVIWGNGKSFNARSIFLGVDSNKLLKKISVFPEQNVVEKIEPILNEVYGQSSMLNGGGFGSLTAITRYDFKIWIPNDKKIQVTFFNSASTEFGLTEISMFFAAEPEAFKNYKLLFRSWEHQEGL